MNVSKRAKRVLPVWLVLGIASCAGDDTAVTADTADTAVPDGDAATCDLAQPVALNAGWSIDNRSAPGFAHGYVYTFDANRGLARVPLDGGEPESVLDTSNAAFTVRDDRVFFATWDGKVGEIEADGSERVIATGQPVPEAISVRGASLYLCSKDDKRVLSIPTDGRGTAREVATSTQRAQCPQITDGGLYWIEGEGAEARIQRTDLEGGDRMTVARLSAAQSWLVSDDDRTLALRGDDALELRPLDGSEARTVAIDATPVRWHDGTLYVAELLSCTPQPNVGNGMPICQGAITQLARDGERLGSFELVGTLHDLAADDACMYWVELTGQCHGGCSLSVHAAPLSVLDPRDS